MQGNGGTCHILPFLKLGHSQFQFPDTKTIQSTCTSRATGNLHFSSFYLLLKITFFSFRGNPTPFFSFNDDGCSPVPFGDGTGKPLPGLVGAAADGALQVQQPSCAFGEGRPEAVPRPFEKLSSHDVQHSNGLPRCPSTGMESLLNSTCNSASLSVFSPFRNCFTGLIRKQDSAALSWGIYFF